MINRIIFDYGGVITYKSRTEVISNSLCLESNRKEQLFNRLRCEDIKKAAVGAYHDRYVTNVISKIFADIDYDDIYTALYLASKPEMEMIKLIQKVHDKYEVCLISNSIPEYSQYILDNFKPLFEQMYLSDREGVRKPKDLFEKIVTTNKSFFTNSIYIDDLENNLILPKKYGSNTLYFTSYRDLLKDLNKLLNIKL